jgi:serine/alanine adding enzyme
MGLDVLDLDDPRWTELVQRAQADIFYEPCYCRFTISGTTHRPVMFAYHDELGEVIDVTVEKHISFLPFFALVADKFPRPPVDLASPEYNSPIVLAEPSAVPELLRRYRQAVDRYCAEHSVVTEFVRFHPLSNSASAYSGMLPLLRASEMLYINLSEGYEQVYRAYRKGHKSDIKKAIKSGAVIEFCSSDDGQVLSELHRLHSDTMVRKSAKSIYHLSADYFADLVRSLGDRVLLTKCLLDGMVVCASLFVLGRKHVWFRYSAADPAYRNTGAHTYALDRAIHWVSENGYEQFMLGGGVDPRDSLYMYKHGFSHAAAPVYHFRNIHDEKSLKLLVEAKRDYDKQLGRETNENYFPSYWL